MKTLKQLILESCLRIYKALEYMDFGPKTRIYILASSSNPSGAKICHIGTTDVAFSYDDDIQCYFCSDNFITESN